MPNAITLATIATLLTPNFQNGLSCASSYFRTGDIVPFGAESTTIVSIETLNSGNSVVGWIYVDEKSRLLVQAGAKMSTGDYDALMQSVGGDAHDPRTASIYPLLQDRLPFSDVFVEPCFAKDLSKPIPPGA